MRFFPFFRSCMFFSLLGCLPLCGDMNFALGSDDPVQVVLDVYQDAIKQQHETPDISTEQRIAFSRDWRERILGVARHNPTSPRFAAAIIKAVGMSNTLGEYETSLRLTRELAATKDDPEWRFRWESESGEIAKQLYGQTRSEEVAAMAIEHFQTAEKIFNEISPDSLTKELQEQKVLNSAFAAALFKAVDDHQQSAEMFKKARQYLNSIEVSSDSRLAAGYDKEYLASSEMIEFLHSGNHKRALEALAVIAAQEEGKLRWPPSYYAHQFVQHRTFYN